MRWLDDGERQTRAGGRLRLLSTGRLAIPTATHSVTPIMRPAQCSSVTARRYATIAVLLSKSSLLNFSIWAITKNVYTLVSSYGIGMRRRCARPQSDAQRLRQRHPPSASLSSQGEGEGGGGGKGGRVGGRKGGRHAQETEVWVWPSSS